MATLPKHYEDYATYGGMSHRLWVALGCTCLAVAGLSAAVYHEATAVSKVRVPIVVIDSTGHATLANYAGANYTPRALELRSAMRQWATDYYSRVRFDLADSYAESLKF